MIIGIKSEDAITLRNIDLVNFWTYPEEKLLPEGGLCRYVYQSDEQQLARGVVELSFSQSKIQVAWTKVTPSRY